MQIGVPREIKLDEARVGITPAGCAEFLKHGHQVLVEADAGVLSGFSDEDFRKAGARILETGRAVYQSADLIVKVKEPLESEYAFIRPGQILFTFFHFASSLELTRAMIESRAVCVAYETIEDDDGSLPLLTPMSEVAGRMAIQEGARWLEKPAGGRGILLGGVPGVLPARVMILGGGTVGTEAARMAAGLGADVTILDVDLPRLRYLAEVLPPNVRTLFSTRHNIERLLPTTDLIVGAVLITGGRAPHLITRDMLANMRPGSVIIDVDVDQGGCVETSHPTNHEQPVFTVDGVLHYCVPNMPGAVPYTSTLALTNATLSFALAIADRGWQEACKDDARLARGLNIVDGDVVYEAVARTFDLKHTLWADGTPASK